MIGSQGTADDVLELLIFLLQPLSAWKAVMQYHAWFIHCCLQGKHSTNGAMSPTSCTGTRGVVHVLTCQVTILEVRDRCLLSFSTI